MLTPVLLHYAKLPNPVKYIGTRITGGFINDFYAGEEPLNAWIEKPFCAIVGSLETACDIAAQARILVY